MSYRVPAHDGEFYHEWLIRASNSVIPTSDPTRSLMEQFEETYNIKVDVDLESGIMRWVEFVSEKDAAMFILRWS